MKNVMGGTEMRIIRKIMYVMLAAFIVLQAGASPVFGESAESSKQIITISNIDASQLTGESAESSTEIDTEGIPQDSIEIVSEEWTGPAEYVISGRNITIKGGKYSYKLVIRSDRTLTFDNDLEIYYQGVDGKYKLHYDIDKNDNHTMIVTGTFDNIIISSPLLDKIGASEREWILTHISEDSYIYQLVLKTKEGFSFVNALRFLIDAKKCGYSVKYSYDLKTDKQTLIISGIPCCDETGPVSDDADEEETIPDPFIQDDPPADLTDSEPADHTGNDNEDAAAPDSTNDGPQAVDPQPKSTETIVLHFSKLRRRSQTIKTSKITGFAVRGQGRVTYIKVSGNRKISINKKTGKVTVKKGLKKGTYNVVVKLKSKGKRSTDRRVRFAVRVI